MSSEHGSLPLVGGSAASSSSSRGLHSIDQRAWSREPAHTPSRLESPQRSWGMQLRPGVATTSPNTPTPFGRNAQGASPSLSVPHLNLPSRADSGGELISFFKSRLNETASKVERVLRDTHDVHSHLEAQEDRLSSLGQHFDAPEEHAPSSRSTRSPAPRSTRSPVSQERVASSRSPSTLDWEGRFQHIRQCIGNLHDRDRGIAPTYSSQLSLLEGRARQIAEQVGATGNKEDKQKELTEALQAVMEETTQLRDLAVRGDEAAGEVAGARRDLEAVVGEIKDLKSRLSSATNRPKQEAVSDSNTPVMWASTGNTSTSFMNEMLEGVRQEFMGIAGELSGQVLQLSVHCRQASNACAVGRKETQCLREEMHGLTQMVKDSVDAQVPPKARQPQADSQRHSAEDRISELALLGVRCEQAAKEARNELGTLQADDVACLRQQPLCGQAGGLEASFLSLKEWCTQANETLRSNMEAMREEFINKPSEIDPAILQEIKKAQAGAIEAADELRQQLKYQSEVVQLESTRVAEDIKTSQSQTAEKLIAQLQSQMQSDIKAELSRLAEAEGASSQRGSADPLEATRRLVEHSIQKAQSEVPDEPDPLEATRRLVEDSIQKAQSELPDAPDPLEATRRLVADSIQKAREELSDELDILRRQLSSSLAHREDATRRPVTEAGSVSDLVTRQDLKESVEAVLEALMEGMQPANVQEGDTSPVAISERSPSRAMTFDSDHSEVDRSTTFGAFGRAHSMSGGSYTSMKEFSPHSASKSQEIIYRQDLTDMRTELRLECAEEISTLRHRFSHLESDVLSQKLKALETKTKDHMEELRKELMNSLEVVQEGADQLRAQLTSDQRARLAGEDQRASRNHNITLQLDSQVGNGDLRKQADQSVERLEKQLEEYVQTYSEQARQELRKEAEELKMDVGKLSHGFDSLREDLIKEMANSSEVLRADIDVLKQEIALQKESSHQRPTDSLTETGSTLAQRTSQLLQDALHETASAKVDCQSLVDDLAQFSKSTVKELVSQNDLRDVVAKLREEFAAKGTSGNDDLDRPKVPVSLPNGIAAVTAAVKQAMEETKVATKDCERMGELITAMKEVRPHTEVEAVTQKDLKDMADSLKEELRKNSTQIRRESSREQESELPEEVEERIGEIESNADCIKDELAKMKEKVDRLETGLIEIEEKKPASDGNLAKDLEEMAGFVEEVRQELSSKIVEMEGKLGQGAVVKDRRHSQDNDRNELEQRLEGLAKQVVDLPELFGTANDDLESKVASLSEKISSLERRLIDGIQKNSDSNSRKESAPPKRAATQSTDLTEQLKGVEEMCSLLHEELQATIKDVVKSNVSSEKRIDDLEASMKSAGSLRLSTLIGEVRNDCEKRLDSLEDIMKAQRKDTGDAGKGVEGELEAFADMVEEIRSDLQKKVDDLGKRMDEGLKESTKANGVVSSGDDDTIRNELEAFAEIIEETRADLQEKIDALGTKIEAGLKDSVNANTVVNSGKSKAVDESKLKSELDALVEMVEETRADLQGKIDGIGRKVEEGLKGSMKVSSSTTSSSESRGVDESMLQSELEAFSQMVEETQADLQGKIDELGRRMEEGLKESMKASSVVSGVESKGVDESRLQSELEAFSQLVEETQLDLQGKIDELGRRIEEGLKESVKASSVGSGVESKGVDENRLQSELEAFSEMVEETRINLQGKIDDLERKIEEGDELLQAKLSKAIDETKVELQTKIQGLEEMSKVTGGGRVIDTSDRAVEVRRVDSIEQAPQTGTSITVTSPSGRISERSLKKAVSFEEPQEPATWYVEVLKDGKTKLGVSINSKTMLIEHIDAVGLIAAWNAAHPEKALRRGDRIMDVNGITDAKKAIEECKNNQNLRMKAIRTDSPRGVGSPNMRLTMPAMGSPSELSGGKPRSATSGSTFAASPGSKRQRSRRKMTASDFLTDEPG